MGSELEKPYSWDNNANLYYRNSSSTLGLSSAPWSAIYGTTIYENGTSLSSKYQAKDDDLTAIAALTGTSGFLKKTAANTWALDTNTYLTSEADTLQTVTNRGATTTTSITTAGLTTTFGYVNITGTSGYSEGIRLHPVGNLSSIWWNATTDKDYCTNGMWGITAYDYGYSDSTKKNTFRFRGPTSQTANSPTDQMWIGGTGLVTSRGGFAKSGSSDSYILLAGGGTKAVSDFQQTGDYLTSESDTLQTVTNRGNSTTNVIKIQNGAASGAFVLGADVNAKTLTANTRKLGRMGVPSYDSTTKTVAGISFDSQPTVNYADFGGHPNNTASIAPDVIRFIVANSHNNAVDGARTLALQISKQDGLVDAAGGGTSVAAAKFFIPVQTASGITNTGSVSSTEGFTHSGLTAASGKTRNDYILLAGGGTKAVSDFSTTDTKVTQSNTTTANWRKVVLSAQYDSAAGTATTATTDQVYVTPNIEVQASTGTLRASGEVQMNKLKITSTAMINHIEFARNNWNYIVASGGSNAAFGFVAGGKSASGANSTFAVLGDRIIPGQTDNKIDLGSSDYHFQDFYIKGKIINGSYEYSLPEATGTLALTTDLADMSLYMPKSGGQFTGPISFKDGAALPQKTLSYIIGIDAFADGGQAGWQSKDTFLSGYTTGTGLTANTILLGNADSKIKTSSKTIVTSISGSANVPTDAAVKSFVEGKGYITSDTKVTNTLNTTTKYYVTGTTSATTNTGTQIFDAAVYVDSVAGELHATTYNIDTNATMKYDSAAQCIRFVIN